ncbi:MAG: ATP-binding cassette domain-containing protein [Cyanobacteria bacterium]|nr:ATP-binding cassette domain-containing protein [Cyanobacteriota bacterium]MDW8199920.1 ATP-binding cassette domain-containing protein [Cyanobacteriota bacterium SKYGB_h_bin112]
MTVPQWRLEQVCVASATVGYPLLHQVTFEVQSGDRLAIVGASGAGKTSLLRLFNRLHDPTSGKLYFHGQDLQQLPVIALRRRVMAVLQEPRLLGMTVREAIAYPLTLQAIPQSEMHQRIDYWLEQMQVPTDWLDRTERQLSVGQRQWVAIVRALVTQPEVLLLDEPTSALDAGRAQHLITVLQNLSAERSLTILMVNHQLQLVQQFSSHVLHLHQGRVKHHVAASEMDWSALRATLEQLNLEANQEWQ